MGLGEALGTHQSPLKPTGQPQGRSLIAAALAAMACHGLPLGGQMRSNIYAGVNEIVGRPQFGQVHIVVAPESGGVLA